MGWLGEFSICGGDCKNNPPCKKLTWLSIVALVWVGLSIAISWRISELITGVLKVIQGFRVGFRHSSGRVP